MTGHLNGLLLDTRTGHTWRLNISSSGMRFSYMPKPTPAPARTAATVRNKPWPGEAKSK